MTVEVANESGQRVDEIVLVSVARYVLDRMGINPLAELSILLKGTASPYATINCDILEEGLERGLLAVENSARPFLKLGVFTLGRRYERTYVINLDRNPPREATRPPGLSPR